MTAVHPAGDRPRSERIATGRNGSSRNGVGRHGTGRPQRFAETRKRQLLIWWREIDRVLLSLILLLMALGAVAVAAASPASARRLSTSATPLDDLHFFWLHLVWIGLGLGVMFSMAVLPRDFARRGAVIVAACMTVALFIVLMPLGPITAPVNGARRWINLGLSIQPSEFLKPAFAITLAWVLSWRIRDQELPVVAITGGYTFLIVGLLMAQPDLGASVLYVGCWGIMAMIAGMPVKWIAGFTGTGVTLLTAAYFLYDNARHRIDAFLGGGTAFDQVDLASRTLMAGGWTGTGLWLGQRKLNLPEAHTDYIFSVIGEEFGLLMCGFVVIIYVAIILRVLSRLVDEDNQFTILAATGLIALFGGQAFINILVNLQLAPSKGMTLPLISYGGSSIVAQCVTIGLLLAITRRNPYLEREKLDLRGPLERFFKA